LRRCWMDDVFRMARKGMGFGLMSSMLVCAEIAAVPYYTSVSKMTESGWLRAICDRLLRDEAMHLRFQATNLGAVWRHCRLLRLFKSCHRALMALTCLVVWREHGEVLQCGGYTRLTFVTSCLDLLEQVHGVALAPGRQQSTAPVPAAVR
jgi:hypothetical protein